MQIRRWIVRRVRRWAQRVLEATSPTPATELPAAPPDPVAAWMALVASEAPSLLTADEVEIVTPPSVPDTPRPPVIAPARRWSWLRRTIVVPRPGQAWKRWASHRLRRGRSRRAAGTGNGATAPGSRSDTTARRAPTQSDPAAAPTHRRVWDVLGDRPATRARPWPRSAPPASPVDPDAAPAAHRGDDVQPAPPDRSGAAPDETRGPVAPPPVRVPPWPDRRAIGDHAATGPRIRLRPGRRSGPDDGASAPAGTDPIGFARRDELETPGAAPDAIADAASVERRRFATDPVPARSVLGEHPRPAARPLPRVTTGAAVPAWPADRRPARRRPGAADAPPVAPAPVHVPVWPTLPPSPLDAGVGDLPAAVPAAEPFGSGFEARWARERTED